MQLSPEERAKLGKIADFVQPPDTEVFFHGKNGAKVSVTEIVDLKRRVYFLEAVLIAASCIGLAAGVWAVVR